jgi:hypothetical protein
VDLRDLSVAERLWWSRDLEIALLRVVNPKAPVGVRIAAKAQRNLGCEFFGYLPFNSDRFIWAAEKKAELEKEEQQEREQAQKSSSGSSVWSTISSVASGIGGALLSLIPALRVIHSPLSISYEIPVAYNQPHR